MTGRAIGEEDWGDVASERHRRLTGDRASLSADSGSRSAGRQQSEQNRDREAHGFPRWSSARHVFRIIGTSSNSTRSYGPFAG